MAQRQRIQDILTVVGPNTYVLRDTEQHLLLEIPEHKFVPGDMLEQIVVLFRDGRANQVQCSLNFDTTAIQLKLSTCAFVHQTRASQNVTLNAVTESERTLVNVAQKLGIIDFDDLSPSFKLGNDDNTSFLEIGGLLHVSHDAVRYCVQDQDDITLEYDMKCKCVRLALPRKAKRKR